MECSAVPVAAGGALLEHSVHPLAARDEPIEASLHLEGTTRLWKVPDHREVSIATRQLAAGMTKSIFRTTHEIMKT